MKHHSSCPLSSLLELPALVGHASVESFFSYKIPFLLVFAFFLSFFSFLKISHPSFNSFNENYSHSLKPLYFTPQNPSVRSSPPLQTTPLFLAVTRLPASPPAAPRQACSPTPTRAKHSLTIGPPRLIQKRPSWNFSVLDGLTEVVQFRPGLLEVPPPGSVAPPDRSEYRSAYLPSGLQKTAVTTAFNVC